MVGNFFADALVEISRTVEHQAKEGDLTRANGLIQRLFIHKAQHQYISGYRILYNGWYQTVCILVKIYFHVKYYFMTVPSDKC